MQALSSWVVRNRLIVSLLWLAVTVVGVVIAPWVSGRLHSGVSLNSPAYTANQQIARHYGGAPPAPGVLTANLPAAHTVPTAVRGGALATREAHNSRGPPMPPLGPSAS